MALTERQQKLYEHRCNIWNVTETITSGVPGAETYTLAASNVPCYYEFTPNLSDDVDAIGRIKRMTVFVTDTIHMEITQPCQNGSIIKNVTFDIDGSQSPMYGTYHRVEGAAREIVTTSRRRPNKASYMAMSIEKPPTGVS